MANHQWSQRPPFHSGDRVRLDNAIGTIEEIFPDGIHFIKVDGSNQIVAAVASQLSPVTGGDHPAHFRRAG